MTQQTPTVAEINDNIINQLQASLNQTIPLLPRSFSRVLAKALAGVFVIVYKYVGFAALQQFVQTATADQTQFNGITVQPLVFWGRLIGVGEPTAATRAELVTRVTVTGAGGTIDAGTALLGSDNGITYTVVSATLASAPTTDVTIRANGDQSGGNGAGAVGNLSAGAVVSFANAPAFAGTDTVVQRQSVTGANAELTEDYRRRVVLRFQRRPQGGALADYQTWGLETPGIINIYPYTGDPSGEVNVYSEAAGTVDGIPTQAQLDAVLASINLDQNGRATRRPAGVRVNSLAITRAVFDVNVVGLTVDNQATVRASITTALTQYLLAREPFITGLSVLPRRDRITATAITAVVEDIVTAAGGTFTSVAFTRSGSAVVSFTLGEGQKSRAGNVTFV